MECLENLSMKIATNYAAHSLSVSELQWESFKDASCFWVGGWGDHSFPCPTHHTQLKVWRMHGCWLPSSIFFICRFSLTQEKMLKWKAFTRPCLGADSSMSEENTFRHNGLSEAGSNQPTRSFRFLSPKTKHTFEKSSPEAWVFFRNTSCRCTGQ